VKEPHLTPRLQCLTDCVPSGARLADVGTDHAYLPAALLLRGRIAHAIASDINAGPLARARRTAREYGLDPSAVEFRLCAGLEGVAPEECDTVVIAGMGGETMIGILAAAPWTRDGAHLLLLQPMTKLAELRAWLAGNGYRIARERIVRERGAHYVVMTAAGGAQALSPADCFAGAAFGGDPLYGEYLDELEGKLNAARAGLARAQRADREARIAETDALLRALAKKREEWEHDDGH